MYLQPCHKVQFCGVCKVATTLYSGEISSVDKTGFLRPGHKCIGNATEVIRTAKDCT